MKTVVTANFRGLGGQSNIMSGATLLVTGATGFLGSKLVEEFVADGCHVVILKRTSSNVWRIGHLLDKLVLIDLENQPFDDIFSQYKFDMVVHCATNYGRRDVSPIDLINANLILPLHLLYVADLFGVKAFINTDTFLDKGVNLYSLSKKQFLDWLRVYSEKMICANVSLEHFYGPYDDPSKFVTRIVRDLLQGVPEIDLTLGHQKRDFIFVSDVVHAFKTIIRFVLSGPQPGMHEFEVGTNQTISVREFVETVRSMVGNTNTVLNFGALPYRENEVMDSLVDTSKLRLLRWQPRVSLSEGLSETILLEKELIHK